MAGAASEVYEPLNQYKPVARNIGIVDGPFEYLTTAGVRLPLPFITRMTVVRLGNGDLFIHSPIAFEPALADRLQAMGTVRHLVSPNQFHYAHIGEWSRAFPGAVAWASPRARKRARSRGIDVHFDRDIGIEPPEEWRAEIDQTAVPGGIFGEIVFFHKESKTLILADTIINLELDMIRQPWRVRRQADRNVLSARPNILRHAVAASFAETKDASGGPKNAVMAARTHHSQPRALVPTHPGHNIWKACKRNRPASQSK